MTTVRTTPTITSNRRSRRTARTLGNASVTNDHVPATVDVSTLRDVSIEEASVEEATDRLVFEFGADAG